VNDLVSAAQALVVPIVVAFITAGGGALAIQKLKKENTKQHNEGKAVNEENNTLLQHLSHQVTGIDNKVDKLDERLDNVAIWQSEHEKEHLIIKELPPKD
jgi:cell division protein FtsB